MKQQYIRPQAVVTTITPAMPITGSGPGAGDVTPPGVKNNSRRHGRSQWDEEEEEDW